MSAARTESARPRSTQAEHLAVDRADTDDVAEAFEAAGGTGWSEALLTDQEFCLGSGSGA